MWLERLERTLKRSESGQFREWLKSNACREVIVERCINFHGPEILAVLSKLIPEEVAAAKLTPPSRRRRTLLAALIGICGGLLTMQLLGWMPWSTSVGASSRFEGAFSTPLDVRRQVNLPDGSVITLNTATLMYVNFGVSERAVTLVRGEASFELKADANHPFRLRIGRRLLQTEASEFVMHRLSREEVAFTIISGAVTVQHELAGTPMTPAQQRDTSSLCLRQHNLAGFGRRNHRPRMADCPPARAQRDRSKVGLASSQMEWVRKRTIPHSCTPVNARVRRH